MDFLQALGIRQGYLLPMLSHMQRLTRNVMNYARALIDEGRRAEAIVLITSATVPGMQLGSHAELVIELLVGGSMRSIALNEGAALHECMDMEQMAQAAREQAEKERQELNTGVYGGTREERVEYERNLCLRGGLIAGVMYPGIPPSGPNVVPPLRRAERFFLERAGLGIVCLVLLLFILWFATITALSSWRHRRDTKGPKLFFVGWKPLGLVIAGAIALPLIVYALWTRVPASGSAHFGIYYAWRRILLEMGVTSAAVIGLALGLGFLSARKRCREAGLAPPTGVHRRWPLYVLLLFLGSIGVHICVTLGRNDFSSGLVVLALGSFLVAIGSLIALIVMSLVRAWRNSEGSEYYGSLRRTMLPILITVLVILGLVGKFHLGVAERSEIAALNRLCEPALSDEIEYMGAGNYREYLRGLPDRGAVSPVPALTQTFPGAREAGPKDGDE